ncbi:B12-binding domain-containing radical SAM protein [Actinokineospora enzanensis]|uniref:B12-binding domain-containing radical SAM protein n=1 Tax=Actinokineospora enzanensis TaxID=155975 RepID=UPI0003678B7B|nr:radical SAM protein [Actinokineospora enzanensis]
MRAAPSELVLPPLSPVLVGRPYAAVPLLAAYAEQRGAPPVRQVNLNQAYVRAELLAAAAEPWSGGTSSDSGTEAVAERLLVSAFPRAVAADPGDAALLAAVARDPAAQAWLFERAGLAAAEDPDVEGDLARLDRMAGMREFFARHYRDRGVPRLLGISVPFATQLAPALLLAEVVRELAGEDVFTVLGGPLPSLLDDAQVTTLLARSAIDGVVRREGEEAFHVLAGLAEFTPRELAAVPSLSFHAAGELQVRPPSGAPQNLGGTRPRPFDPEYLDGAVELPVMVGRGCFYTCAFCDYIELYEKINFRRAADVTESAALAAAQSSTGKLHFVYEVMSLRYERKLAGTLAAAGLGVRWRGFQRVFGEMTAEDVRLLESSGCARLDIGLESADDPTLTLMNKGYTRAEIAAFLAAFAGSGIQLLINIIVDYPGLDYQRAMAAARFLAEATRDIEDVHFEVLRFALGRNSQMHREPDRFGLDLVDVSAPTGRPSSPTQVAFRSTWSMPVADRDRVEAYYREVNAGFRDRRVRRAEEAGVLGADTRAWRGWVVRGEPVVAVRSSDDLVVRRMLTGETFLLPLSVEPVITAYRAVGEGNTPLTAFLTEAAPALRAADMTPRDGAELLLDLDLLRRRPGAGIRAGIASDGGFYRGGRRRTSPGVAP